MVLTGEGRRKARYKKAMAEENQTNRSFDPLTIEDVTASQASDEAGAPTKRSPSRGIPKARVDPRTVKEFESELDDKVTSGRNRMRWFANHFILFVIGIAVAIGLKLSIYSDLEDEFFLVGLGAWVGILAIHARYAMTPILMRSDKESQLKAVIPEAEESENGESG